MKEHLIVSLIAAGMLIVLMGLLILIGYITNVRPNFGILALCYICLREARDLRRREE